MKELILNKQMTTSFIHEIYETFEEIKSGELSEDRMKELKIYQVDAFTKEAFKGNPAGVCVLDQEVEDSTLDFPIDEPIDIIPSDSLLNAMGITEYKRTIIGKSTRKLVIHLNSEENVVALKPNFDLMNNVSDSRIKGAGVTTEGSGKYDMVSRYFNPWAGVNEDSVTGSVHTLLASYWGKLKNKNELLAYQASERGGEILLRME